MNNEDLITQLNSLMGAAKKICLLLKEEIDDDAYDIDFVHAYKVLKREIFNVRKLMEEPLDERLKNDSN